MARGVLEHQAPVHALTDRAIRPYLESRFGPSVRVIRITPLDAAGRSGELKGFGYREPVKIDYEVQGQRRTAVLETVTAGPFGHEHMADRAQALLWTHRAFNRLPHHVRSLDVGGFRADGSLVSVRDIDEFFILTEFAAGEAYYLDLERLRDGGELCERDAARADALCDYLVDIHRTRGRDPELYARRLRELVGGHECIAGVIDSYAEHIAGGDKSAQLEAIEHACTRWRWRLKPLADRLRQIHGDFHPWNILFEHGDRFIVLGRARGEWGDPADDVASMVMNYVFFSLQRSGGLDEPFESLFTRFWRRYEEKTGDDQLPEVIAPYLAFRGLVMASPVWYPHVTAAVRHRLLVFVHAVLGAPRFDPERINEYCGS